MDPTTQDFLEIKDIKDGVITLKNNQIRGILLVSSINFVLRSEQAQSYQNYLKHPAGV